MMQTVYFENGQAHYKLSNKIPDKQVLRQKFYRFQCNEADTVYVRQIKEWNLKRVDSEIDFLCDSYWYAESLLGIIIWRIRKLLLRPYWRFVKLLYKCNLFRIEEAAQFSWGTVKWFWQKDYYALTR